MIEISPFPAFLPMMLVLISGCGKTDADSGAQDGAKAVEEGRKVAQLCVGKDAHALFARFTPGMAQAVPEPTLKDVLDRTNAVSPIGKRQSEKVSSEQGLMTYVAVHAYGDRQIAIRVTFDSAWGVAGLLLRPMLGSGGPPPDPKAGYQTKARLRLPFRGEWYIFWGGPTLAQNYHVESRDQRHAYDIVIRRNGSTHKGDGKKNEDYYAFGEPVFAPADGIVVKVGEGVRDNVPGVMNPAQLYGNHVVVDLGNDEYCVICHFKNGSIRVAEGQKVKTGEALGQCGNSGNSSEAHIHFHLQDKPALGAATGLPAPFVDYVADGKRVARAIPVRGQLVRSGR